jgi:5-deoxy-glucuronate isomerase
VSGGHHIPSGTSGNGALTLEVTPESAGWRYSSLRLLELAAGTSHTFDTEQDEVLVLPLSGACRVEVAGEVFDLVGRESVFSGVTDFVYAPREATVTVTSERGGRFALPAARATTRLPARYAPASSVPVELRGAGTASRQVNNFCTPQAFDADALIACEVLTPGGNWSSYPPHKHDEQRPGEEAELEEIYYFEVADSPQGAPGVGYQRVYGTEQRPLDVLEEVRSGDVVLIPHGWHGPSMAAPGYDLYYLNVMAGPGDDRAWLICDDPAHAWVRGTWDDQPVDPRLPFYTSTPPSSLERS